VESGIEAFTQHNIVKKSKLDFLIKLSLFVITASQRGDNLENTMDSTSRQQNPPGFSDEQLRWLANSHPEILQQVQCPAINPQDPPTEPPPPYSPSSQARQVVSTAFHSRNPFQDNSTNARQAEKQSSSQLQQEHMLLRNSTAQQLPIRSSSSATSPDRVYPGPWQENPSGARGHAHSPDAANPASLDPASLSPQDKEILAKTLAFISQIPSPPFRHPRLAQPILIPQTPSISRGLSRGIPSTFIPAYSPLLSAYNIPPSSFLEFLLNLNVVAAASPPLQALDAVGGVIGMIPHHWAQLTGAGIQVGSQVGAKLVSRTRRGLFIKEVNARVFAGRGLIVKVIGFDELCHILGFGPEEGARNILAETDIDEDLLKNVLESVQRRGAARLIHGDELEILDGVDFRQETGELNWMDKLSKKQMDRDKIRAARKEVQRKEKEDRKARKRERRESKKERKRERKNKGDKKKYRDSSSVTESSSDEDIEQVADGKSKGKEKRSRKQDKEDRKQEESREKALRKMMWILIENL
jgi:hypothetical protein